FIDTTGRSYAIDPITLPSARGQGEPLTGKLTLPPGATVEHMLLIGVFFLPDSPRWFAAKRRFHDAERVLLRLRDTSAEAKREL
ncbi:MFS transporter, partial [Salmonella enterica subsp. enterica serovar Montevideo]|nr:MFS transporter [Salmonella enterica subsp. enterica serovar Montevideo]